MAADAPERATDFISKITDRFKPLLDNPEIGPARHELATGLRVQFHGNYAIYYTFTETELIIVRVLHGARDAAALFGSGD
ncbi:MAG: type II toxin-antitoxin system RelE/ParE family toxin [Pseudomonadota bacterium]